MVTIDTIINKIPVSKVTTRETDRIKNNKVRTALIMNIAEYATGIKDVLPPAPADHDKNNTLFEASCLAFEHTKNTTEAVEKTYHRLFNYIITYKKDDQTESSRTIKSALGSVEVGSKRVSDIKICKGRFHARNIWNEKPQSLDWLVQDYIPENSITVIFGDTNVGKTFIALDIAACVATGTSFHGHIVKQAAVLYIAAEGGNGLISRLGAWKANKGITQNAQFFKNTTVINLMDFKTAQDIIDFINYQMADNPPKLIVFDTWSRNLGGDDVTNSDAAAGIRTLDKIKEALPEIALLIIHHTGLKEKERARGASALKAALDAEFRVTLKGKDLLDGKLILECTKMRDTEYTGQMTLKTKLLTFSTEQGEESTNLVLEPCENDPDIPYIKLAPSQQKIMDALEKAGSKVSRKDLMKLFNKRATFYNAIKELKNKKLINEQGNDILRSPF